MDVNQHYLFEARQLQALSLTARAAGSPVGSPPPASPARLWGVAAVAGLVAGTGLLVFLDPAWAHGLGVACLVRCAVAVFRLASSPPAP